MLASLAIRDVVLIDRLDLGFAPGLTVLTGETGAGKSILLDALGLALGQRGDAGLVRHGAAQASVTAVFEIRDGHEARVRQLFLGPEIRNFEAMANAAGQLAAEEARRNAEVERRFDDRLSDAKKTLVVVGLGAGVLIILLLLTASDIARLALERHAEREP